jgi:CheY-like chemotaxis protein
MQFDHSSVPHPCEVFVSGEHYRRQRRVLVVDDYEDAADALCMYFDACSFDAQVCYRGLSAVETTREWCPSIVFLDISMPAMSGLEVAVQLKSMAETAATILVAYTANVSGADVENLKQAGFNAFCAKPADPTHLLLLAEFLLDQ